MKCSIRSVGSAGALLAILSLGLNSVRADQQIGAQFNQPVSATVNVNESGCDNSPGPYITIDGGISLGGLGLRLILANNNKMTHKVEVVLTTNITLIPLGAGISIPKQPVRGGVGGNPHIWMQFYNKKGNLSDEIYLGRCVQGLKVKNDSLNDSIAALVLSFLDCNNTGGPNITFGGGMNMSGIKAKLIFRNNMKGTHTAESQASVSILPDDTLVTIPKQPVRGGAGGNPLVWAQLLHGNGNAINDPIFLGRCNKL